MEAKVYAHTIPEKNIFLLDKRDILMYNDKADFGDCRNCTNMAA